jgi:hypothetical protein
LRRQQDVFVARLINPPFLALLFWLFFARLTLGPSSPQDRVGILQETTALPFVGMLACIAIFPGEKSLFFHEWKSSGRQSVLTFIMAYTVQEAAVSIVASLVRPSFPASSLILILTPDIAAVLPHHRLWYWPSAYAEDLRRVLDHRVLPLIHWRICWGESLASRPSNLRTDLRVRQIIFCTFFDNGGLAVSLVSAGITILAQLNGIISVTLPYWLEVVGWYVSPFISLTFELTSSFDRASPMKSQARIEIINEMNGLVFECTAAQISSGACIAATGDQLLNTFSIPPGGTGLSPPFLPLSSSTRLTKTFTGKLIAIIISLVLLFRIGAWLAVRVKVMTL